MKAALKKAKGPGDDSLFGLLSSYKSNNTYIKILVSDKEKSIIVLLTDNPKKWNVLLREKYKEFVELRRLEIKAPKLSLKYINPLHLVMNLGPTLGIRIPDEKSIVTNRIDDEGYYIFETSIKYKLKVLQGIKKILNFSPQKRYEILEKCIAECKD